MLHHVRWLVIRDIGNVPDLFVLSLVSVRWSFFAPHRGGVRDHANDACLRDILMRSGSRRLVDTCTWLIVAHRYARTSSHSAERLNLCPSGKELSSMFHLSLFLVICALKQPSF